MAFTDDLALSINGGQNPEHDVFLAAIFTNLDELYSERSEWLNANSNRFAEAEISLHTGGSGLVWFSVETNGANTEVVIDTGTTDFRFRKLKLRGLARKKVSGEYQPGETNDDLLYNTVVFDEFAQDDNTHIADLATPALLRGSFFSSEGSQFTAASYPYSQDYLTGFNCLLDDSSITVDNGPLRLYVNQKGDLCCTRGSTGDDVDMVINGVAEFYPQCKDGASGKTWIENYLDRINDGDKVKWSHIIAMIEMRLIIKSQKPMSYIASVNVTGSQNPYDGGSYEFDVPVNVTTSTQKIYDNDVDLRGRFLMLEIGVIPDDDAGAYMPDGGSNFYCSMHQQWTSWIAGAGFFYAGTEALAAGTHIANHFQYVEDGSDGAGAGPECIFSSKWAANTAPEVRIWVDSTDGDLNCKRDSGGLNTDSTLWIRGKASPFIPADTSHIYDFFDTLKTLLTAKETKISYMQALSENLDAMAQRTPECIISDQFGDPAVAGQASGGSRKIMVNMPAAVNSVIAHCDPDFDCRDRLILVSGLLKMQSSGQYEIGGQNELMIKGGSLIQASENPTRQKSNLIEFEVMFFSNGSGIFDLKYYTTIALFTEGQIIFLVPNSGPAQGQLIIYRTENTDYDDETDSPEADDIDLIMAIEMGPRFVPCGFFLCFAAITQSMTLNQGLNWVAITTGASDVTATLPASSGALGKWAGAWFDSDGGGKAVVDLNELSADVFYSTGATAYENATMSSATGFILGIHRRSGFQILFSDGVTLS